MKRLIALAIMLSAVVLAQLVPTVGVQDPVTRQLATVANGGLGVQGVGNATGSTGQQAVTGTATALPSFAAKQICINALSTNSISVFIGFSSGVTTSTGFELTAKAGVCLPVTNANLIYSIASTTGASLTWIGTN